GLFDFAQKLRWADLAHILTLPKSTLVKHLRPHALDRMAQGQNNAKARQQLRDSINLPSFEAGIRRRNLSTDRSRITSILRCEVCFIPVQVVLQHLRHKEEIQLLTFTQLYIGMALKRFVKPG